MLETMFEQCVKFQPNFAALDDENAAKVLRRKLFSHHIKTEVLDGQKPFASWQHIQMLIKLWQPLLGQQDYYRLFRQ